MKKRHLLLIPVFLLLWIIWGNSLLTGEESGAISKGLLAWLISAFPFLNWLPEYLLRKLGHFSEFAALGFFLAWYFLLQGQTGIHRFSVPLLWAMLAANTDETIQTMVPDRGPSVLDVWIDVSGACAGIAALLLIFAAVQYRKKRKGISR